MPISRDPRRSFRTEHGAVVAAKIWDAIEAKRE